MWKVPCTHLPWLSCELQKHIGLSCFPYDFSCRHRLTESWSFQCLRALYDGNQWCQVLPWKGGRQCQHQKNLPLHWLTFSSGPYKRRKRQRLNGMRGRKSRAWQPCFWYSYCICFRKLKVSFGQRDGSFQGKWEKLAFPRDLFRQGGCSNCHVPAAYSQGVWQRTYARSQPNCRAVLDWHPPVPASGAGGFNIRVPS